MCLSARYGKENRTLYFMRKSLQRDCKNYCPHEKETVENATFNRVFIPMFLIFIGRLCAFDPIISRSDNSVNAISDRFLLVNEALQELQNFKIRQHLTRGTYYRFFIHIYWHYLFKTPYKFYTPQDLTFLNVMKTIVPQGLKKTVKVWELGTSDF